MSKRAFMSAPEINLITVITEINKIFEPVVFNHRIPKRYRIELSCLNIENAMSKGLSTQSCLTPTQYAEERGGNHVDIVPF